MNKAQQRLMPFFQRNAFTVTLEAERSEDFIMQFKITTTADNAQQAISNALMMTETTRKGFDREEWKFKSVRAIKAKQ